jgi:hypothetical protein
MRLLLSNIFWFPRYLWVCYRISQLEKELNR